MKTTLSAKKSDAGRVPRKILWALFAAALTGCGKPQPAKPIELHLTLAKSRIQTGEFLWYRVEMTNVGRKPIKITDQFWCWQGSLSSDFNKAQTAVDIIGPDGEKVFPDRLAWGYHDEHHFWTNDTSGEGPCIDSKLTPTRPLDGGDTWVATPSAVAPIRGKDPDIMDDWGDARSLPEIPRNWSPEQIEELKIKWKAAVEQSGYMYGNPTFRSTTTPSAVPQPRGYRVLEIYDFDKPGKYRMRIVYSPFGRNTTADEEEARLMEIHETLGDYLALWGWPKETRVFDFESNWVEFEVVASSFPEHLFPHSKNESPEQRKRTEFLKKLMKNNAPPGKSPAARKHDWVKDTLRPAPKTK